MKEDKKGQSKLEKRINKLKNDCTAIHESNTLRKYQITQFNNFVRKLIQEGRVTKKEAGEFIKSKQENKKLLEDFHKKSTVYNMENFESKENGFF